MAARAYILIETSVGQAREVLASLRAMENVTEADIITGNYDLIALAEAEDMVALVDLVTAQVQNIYGVERTITCVAA
jgi:DNA-binding Lrp family transcriptional regulator